jgi:hypothetical protein
MDSILKGFSDGQTDSSELLVIFLEILLFFGRVNSIQVELNWLSLCLTRQSCNQEGLGTLES